MDVSVSGVGVLDKAVAVLASLEGGPRSLPELEAATGLPRPTAPLPLDRGAAGRARLGLAVGRGWVESVAEREAGVASVSAPVRDGDGVVRAALGVSGPIERTTRSPGRRYGAAVVRAARAVEAAAFAVGAGEG